MNLILFEPGETDAPLPANDPRVRHLLGTLRRKEGDRFDAGIIDGCRGKGHVTRIGREGVQLEFEPLEPPRPLFPVTLLAGLPRPQAARRILQEGASLGITGIHFVHTERGEPSYGGSRLWAGGEFRRHLIAGTEQRFGTRLPEVGVHPNLSEALDRFLPVHSAAALDNYEATAPLKTFYPKQPPALLAVGSERGWTGGERDLFRSRGVPLLRLGEPVLRTETASICGLTLLLAAMGFF